MTHFILLLALIAFVFIVEIRLKHELQGVKSIINDIKEDIQNIKSLQK